MSICESCGREIKLGLTALIGNYVLCEHCGKIQSYKAKSVPTSLRGLISVEDETGIDVVNVSELLETHVVIPKGMNRHPNADVWIEWLNDTSKVIEVAVEPSRGDFIMAERDGGQTPTARWIPLHDTMLGERQVRFFFTDMGGTPKERPIRIRPEVRELYQYAYLEMGCDKWEISGHMTELEASARFRLTPYSRIDGSRIER